MGSAQRFRSSSNAGAKRRRYLQENVAATEIELTDEDLRPLDQATLHRDRRGRPLPDMSTVEL